MCIIVLTFWQNPIMNISDNDLLYPAGAEVNIIPVMQGEGPLKIEDRKFDTSIA